MVTVRKAGDVFRPSGGPARFHFTIGCSMAVPSPAQRDYTLASMRQPTNIGLYSVVVANSQGLDISGTASLGFFDIQLGAGSPTIYLNAPVGASYRIEAATQLSPADWTTLTNVTVNTQPFIFTGFASATNAAGFIARCHSGWDRRRRCPGRQVRLLCPKL